MLIKRITIGLFLCWAGLIHADTKFSNHDLDCIIDAAEIYENKISSGYDQDLARIEQVIDEHHCYGDVVSIDNAKKIIIKEREAIEKEKANIFWKDIFQISILIILFVVIFSLLTPWRWNVRTKLSRTIWVVSATWIIFVILRSINSYEILGFNLEKFNSDYFILNLLLPLILIGFFIRAYVWINSAQKDNSQ